MGEIRINLTNFLTIGLIAFVFIYVATKALAVAGISLPGQNGG